MFVRKIDWKKIGKKVDQEVDKEIVSLFMHDRGFRLTMIITVIICAHKQHHNYSC